MSGKNQDYCVTFNPNQHSQGPKPRQRRPYRDRRPALPDSVIRYVRVLHNLTICQLAEEVGICRDVIVDGERGKFNSCAFNYEMLAAYFQMPLDDILTGRLCDVIKEYQLPRSPRPRSAVKRARKRHKQCLENGTLGEEIVRNLELERLKDSPYAGCVNSMFADRINEKFDLLSFTPDGLPVYIEVKTTNQGLETPFFMSAGELEFMQRSIRNNWNYQIYRLYDVQDKDHFKLYVISGKELESLVVKPSEYKVELRREKR